MTRYLFFVESRSKVAVVLNGLIVTCTVVVDWPTGYGDTGKALQASSDQEANPVTSS